MNLLKLLAQTVVLLILLAVAWAAWVYQDYLTPVAEELVTLYTGWNQNAHWSKPAAGQPELSAVKSFPVPSAATAPAAAGAGPSSPADAGASLVRTQPEPAARSAAEPAAAAAPAPADSTPAAAPAVAAVPSAADESGAVPAKPPLGAAPEGAPPSQPVAQESAPAAPVAAPAVTSAGSKTAVAPDQALRSADTPSPPPSSQPAASDPGTVLGRGTEPHLSATTLVANLVEPPVDALALHARARRAAWSGQTDAAIAAYQQLIVAQPQSADAHGELGNVYFQAKRLADAAVEYEKAALLLVDQGDRTRIWQLLQALRGLDAARARAVEEKLLARER